MSDYECVIYYGLKFKIAITEIHAIDEETDERVIAANREDLDYYCGDFGSMDNQYFLFVGTEFGIMGRDEEAEVQLTAEEYKAIAESTRAKLRRAGFKDSPQLHMQWLEVFY